MGSQESLGAAGPTITGRLGDFRLIREVGRGGMGVVYEAEQVSLGRRVALKVLPLAAALDSRQLQRFRLEAQAAAHLHHSHIVPIYSVGCERGVYYYAMQFIQGRSLAEVIHSLQERQHPGAASHAGAPEPSDLAARDVEPADEVGMARDTAARDTAARRETAAGLCAGDSTLRSIHSPIFFRSVAAIGMQAADALEYAHAMGVIHRDIKPANLLLGDAASIYIADFGLAQLQGDSRLTFTGDLVGTLRYMSPEQTMARRGLVDHRSDIYSLGATLYELLTLAPAFDAGDRHLLLREIADRDPVAPRQRNRSIPVDLETIVLKAMAKEPERRYATAKELAEDLARFLEQRPITARPPTAPERAARWLRRHRTVVAGVVCLLLLVAIGLGVSTALVAREQWKTQAAYDRLAEEQAKTKAAYEAEAKQRARAEKSFRQARQIVDFFTEVSEEELADKAESQGLRRMLLAASLDYYQGFIAEGFDDPSLQAQLAASHLRVGGILEEIGSKAEAMAALDKARQIQEKLVVKHPSAADVQNGLVNIYSRIDALRGGRELHLLGQKSVQEDLRLDDNQLRDIAQLWEQRRRSFRELRDLTPEEWHAKFDDLGRQETVLANLLRPEQRLRLKQIALQQRGVHAFNDAEIAKALGLTREQQEQIRPLERNTRELLAARFGSGELGPEEWQAVKDSWQKVWQQILDVLTDEQEERWKQLTGEPFKGKLYREGAGRGGRRGPDGHNFDGRGPEGHGFNDEHGPRHNHSPHGPPPHDLEARGGRFDAFDGRSAPIAPQAAAP